MDITIQGINITRREDYHILQGQMCKNGGEPTNRIVNSDTPYTVLARDCVLFFDTDSGAIEADLPAGVQGKHYKLVNCGTGGNALTVDPNGNEEVYGAGAGVAKTVADGVVLDIHFDAVEGWF